MSAGRCELVHVLHVDALNGDSRWARISFRPSFRVTAAARWTDCWSARRQSVSTCYSNRAR